MQMKQKSGDRARLEMAARVRDACIQAAREGYEEALLAGLCHEGAWENAVSAMQRLDLTLFLTLLSPSSDEVCGLVDQDMALGRASVIREPLSSLRRSVTTRKLID